MPYREYKHLIQKPLFCFPTCVAMVALRRGVWLDQEQFALHMGIKITPEFKGSFGLQFPMSSVLLGSGYDVPSIDIDFLNTVLAQLQMPFTAAYYRVSEIADPAGFVDEQLEHDHDVALLYTWRGIETEHTFCQGQERFAHYVLVSEFDAASGQVTVCDPEGTNPSLWSEQLSTFTTAMKPDFDGYERGFFVFTTRELEPEPPQADISL